MKAMILAAGFGTRLGELTAATPKPLINIQGHYLIEYPLALLKKAGIREVIINTHYLAGQIEQALGDGSKYDLRITYSREDKILGTGGGVKKAETYIGGETFILINSDVICNIDLNDVLSSHRSHKSDATMVLYDDPSLPNFDEIKLTRAGRILSINDSPPLSGSRRTIHRVFTGIHFLEPVIFEYLHERFSSIITDFYQPAIADQRKILGYDFKGYWVDVGTRTNLETAIENPRLKRFFKE
jgi:mannose-1-phosphate guanylyltransferase